MVSRSTAFRLVSVLLAGMLLATAAEADNPLSIKKGKGGSDVQGAAGTQGAQGAASDLQRCDKPMGAVAVVEPQDYVMSALSRYNLQSPVGLIRAVHDAYGYLQSINDEAVSLTKDKRTQDADIEQAIAIASEWKE